MPAFFALAVLASGLLLAAVAPEMKRPLLGWALLTIALAYLA